MKKELGTKYQFSVPNQIDEAIAEYKKAIKIDYNLSVAHTNLGVAYEQKGISCALYSSKLPLIVALMTTRHTTSDKAQAEFQEAIRLDMLDKQR